MITQKITYELNCDICGQIAYPQQPIEFKTQYLLTFYFKELGWIFERDKARCPKCIKKIKPLDLSKLNGKHLIDSLNEFKYTTNEFYNVGNSLIYKDEELKDNVFSVDFLIDSDECIYKFNTIAIYNDSSITVNLCERYAGGGAEKEIKRYLEQYIKDLK